MIVIFHNLGISHTFRLSTFDDPELVPMSAGSNERGLPDISLCSDTGKRSSYSDIAYHGGCRYHPLYSRRQPAIAATQGLGIICYFSHLRCVIVSLSTQQELLVLFHFHLVRLHYVRLEREGLRFSIVLPGRRLDLFEGCRSRTLDRGWDK